MQPACDTYLYGEPGADHGKKAGDAMWEEGSGSCEDMGQEGFVVWSCELQQLLSKPDKGFEKPIEPGCDKALI